MQINFIYDSSVNAAPAGFKAALNAVAQAAQTYFTDPITVNIQVGWGEDGGQPLSPGAIGEALPNLSAVLGVTFAQLKSALMQHASSIDDVTAISNLPATDPTGGGLIYLSSAQAKALGLVPPNGTGIDGHVGFSTTAPWDFTPNDPMIPPGFYDFAATAVHEITHAIGRVVADQVGAIDLLSFFRYSAPGNNHVAPGQLSYFSIDGGKTPLHYFATSGDLGDWLGSSVPPDANDAIATPGLPNTFSLTDFTEMEALGFGLNLAAFNLPGMPRPLLN
jgi:hypothetical protein